VAGDLQLALELYPEDGPRVRTPREHGELLHAGGKGTVAISHKANRRWNQTVYPVEVALALLDQYRGQDDVFLSTQRFRGRRRISELLSMGALFADLDYYGRPEFAAEDPRRVLELALGTLSMAGVPAPSIAIGSGRGMYLIWLHSSIPRAALPRWRACQERLKDILAPLGADPKARDAARVLRVVGTRHRRAGATVEALTTVREVRPFDELADLILPYTRAEIRDLRVQKALRKAQKPLWTPPEGFTQATLWEARLSDLQALRELRWFGEPMPDYRDRWLFLAGVAMSWISPPEVLHRELHALAEEVGGWTPGHTDSKMHAIFRTAREHQAGKRVEWAGMEVSPRYRFRNETIIEALEITPEEERHLKTIISDEERRRRDRDRKEKERRAKGVRPRAEVAAERQREASRLASEGLSNTEIARRLGISRRHVYKLLETGNLKPIVEGVN
jgi:DNA-binding CsgD family transcriptional regulator